MYCWAVEQICWPLVCALIYHWKCPSKSKNQPDLCRKALVCFSIYLMLCFKALFSKPSRLFQSLFLYTQKYWHAGNLSPLSWPLGMQANTKGPCFSFSPVSFCYAFNKGLHLYESVRARCESSCPSMTDAGIVRQLLSQKRVVWQESRLQMCVCGGAFIFKDSQDENVSDELVKTKVKLASWF